MNTTTATKDTKANGHTAPATEKKADVKTEAKTEKAAATEGEAEAKREAAKVYLVVGAVMEFKSITDAEKYLNTAPDAPKDFSVIKGKKIEKKQKVSLR